MATEYLEATGTVVQGNYVYPYPINPYWNPYGTTALTWPTLDETRLAALEARITKLERENKRLRRGLGKLYIRQKEAK